jgi:hypothetical protein
LLQQQYQTRVGQIRTGLQQLQQEREAEVRRAHEDYVKTLPQQKAKLLDLNPTWRDAAKLDADQKAMISYAKTRGLTDQQLNGITDPALVMILFDAMRFSKLESGKPAALKQVRAAPQKVRTGSRTERDPKVASYNQARERAESNPRDLDAQAAVFDHFV